MILIRTPSTEPYAFVVETATMLEMLKAKGWTILEQHQHPWAWADGKVRFIARVLVPEKPC